MKAPHHDQAAQEPLELQRDFIRTIGKRLIIQAYMRGYIRAVTVVRLFARYDLSGA